MFTPRAAPSCASDSLDARGQESLVAASTPQTSNPSPYQTNHDSTVLESFSMQVDPSKTVVQTLEGLKLEASKIDDCFNLLVFATSGSFPFGINIAL